MSVGSIGESAVAKHRHQHSMNQLRDEKQKTKEEYEKKLKDQRKQHQQELREIHMKNREEIEKVKKDSAYIADDELRKEVSKLKEQLLKANKKKKELMTDLESQKDACTKYRKELRKSHETAAKSKVRYEHKMRDFDRRLEKAENTRQELNKKKNSEVLDLTNLNQGIKSQFSEWKNTKEQAEFLKGQFLQTMENTNPDDKFPELKVETVCSGADGILSKPSTSTHRELPPITFKRRMETHSSEDEINEISPGASPTAEPNYPKQVEIWKKYGLTSAERCFKEWQKSQNLSNTPIKIENVVAVSNTIERKTNIRKKRKRTVPDIRKTKKIKKEDPSAVEIIDLSTNSSAKKRKTKHEPKKSTIPKKRGHGRKRGRSKSVSRKRGKSRGREVKKRTGTKSKRRNTPRNSTAISEEIDNNDLTCRYCFKGASEQFELYCCDNPECTASIHQRCLRKKSDNKNDLYNVTRFPESWLKSFSKWFCPSCAPELLHIPVQNKNSLEILPEKEWPLQKNKEKWLRDNPEYQIAWTYSKSTKSV